MPKTQGQRPEPKGQRPEAKGQRPEPKGQSQSQSQSPPVVLLKRRRQLPGLTLSSYYIVTRYLHVPTLLTAHLTQYMTKLSTSTHATGDRLMINWPLNSIHLFCCYCFLVHVCKVSTGILRVWAWQLGEHGSLQAGITPAKGCWRAFQPSCDNIPRRFRRICTGPRPGPRRNHHWPFRPFVRPSRYLLCTESVTNFGARVLSCSMHDDLVKVRLALALALHDSVLQRKRKRKAKGLTWPIDRVQSGSVESPRDIRADAKLKLLSSPVNLHHPSTVTICKESAIKWQQHIEAQHYIMNQQLPVAELIAPLKSYINNPPDALTKNSELRCATMLRSSGCHACVRRPFGPYSSRHNNECLYPLVSFLPLKAWKRTACHWKEQRWPIQLTVSWMDDMPISCEMRLFPSLGRDNQPKTLTQLSESTKSEKILR